MLQGKKQTSLGLTIQSDAAACASSGNGVRFPNSKYGIIALVLIAAAFFMALAVKATAALLPPAPDVFADYQAIMPGEPDGGLAQYPCEMADVSQYETTATDKVVCVLMPDEDLFHRVMVFAAEGEITGMNLYTEHLRMMDLIWQWGKPDKVYKLGHRYHLQWGDTIQVIGESDRRYSPQAPVRLISIKSAHF
jgi:hypothetical protein